ncbi:MAG: ATP-binding cassette domain-containing protein [Bacteroidales bacterium]|nr:ATP-binding cassette domain-containing protein [Bacteroidales bacterium]
MRESFLVVLIKYCALIASIFNCEENTTKKGFLQFIKKNSLNHLPDLKGVEKTFTEIFKGNTQEHALFEISDPDESFSSILLNELTHTTIQTLSLNDRIVLLMLVTDFFHSSVPAAEDKFRMIESIGCRFGLSREEVNDIWNLLTNPAGPELKKKIIICKAPAEEAIETLEGSWIENNLPENYRVNNEIEIENLTEDMTILFLERNKLFVVKCPCNSELEIEGSAANLCRFKILEPGSSVKTKNHTLIHYTDIKNRYFEYRNLATIDLVIEDISFVHHKRKKGIRGISLTERSGQLIGILGKEGAGKTTLLELLAGRINPDTGKILINNYNLKTNKYLLKSIIGYIPEEDLLFDELTVYDNLMLTAQMFFGKMHPKELSKKVNSLLDKLDLLKFRNTIVGSVFEKNLQPGQRRLLNIALELLREPKILLVDNPVYGLNISESSRIIELLHEYTFGGNLVITSIRQTNHLAFSMFDKLWVLDEGGYLIYSDVSYKASDYFVSSLKNRGIELAPVPNTPENILQLIEHKISDSSEKNGERKISPQEWYSTWLDFIKLYQLQKKASGLPLPAGMVKLPNLETQFRIFSIRNFKIKFPGKWKNLYTLLAAPVLAVLMGFFLRESGDNGYIFAENPNIPLYFFASSVICLFLGLAISSNEILKERSILAKEEYMEFSRFSYINSKITYLFIIALFQTLLYSLAGNMVLGIKEMFLQTWAVLFSVCCSGIVLGLIFSSAIGMLKTIYEKAIPITIVLQMLFGGGLINYGDLNIGTSTFSPVIGDLMVTKWAYEALMVEQFMKNKYEKAIYPYEKQVRNNLYFSNTLIPITETFQAKSKPEETASDTLKKHLTLIRYSLDQIDDEAGIFPFEYLDKLTPGEYNELIASETKDYITYLKLHFNETYLSSLLAKNNFIEHLKDSLGSEGFETIKNNYYNNAVANHVQMSASPVKYKISGNRICQVTGPIYQKPYSDWGRAMMFLPEKKLRGDVMNTLWFNITITWLITFILYIFLLIYQPSLASIRHDN